MLVGKIFSFVKYIHSWANPPDYWIQLRGIWNVKIFWVDSFSSHFSWFSVGSKSFCALSVENSQKKVHHKIIKSREREISNAKTLMRKSFRLDSFLSLFIIWFKQKSLFWIGLGPIVIDFPCILWKLTDNSNHNGDYCLNQE